MRHNNIEKFVCYFYILGGSMIVNRHVPTRCANGHQRLGLRPSDDGQLISQAGVDVVLFPSIGIPEDDVEGAVADHAEQVAVAVPAEAGALPAKFHQ